MKITAIEGTGLARNVSETPVQADYVAKQRFRGAFCLSGQNLESVTEWTLTHKEQEDVAFTLNAEANKEGCEVLLSFKTGQIKGLIAGMFLLTGVTAAGQNVSAEVFLLQGEGLDAATLAQIKVLLQKVKVDKDTDKVTITAKDVLVSTPGRFSIEAKDVDVRGQDSVQMSVKQANFSMSENLGRFTAMNVQVVNGSGQSDKINALGNLVVGYNENTRNRVRTGSHNILVGTEHGYESHSGFISGSSNRIFKNAEFSTVAGGSGHVVGKSDGSELVQYATVSGGSNNQVMGSNATASGGANNQVMGSNATASGG
ncbi:MAG: hypothetical protein AAGJ35_06965, partial [Myxococcota bacterium]